MRLCKTAVASLLMLTVTFISINAQQLSIQIAAPVNVVLPGMPLWAMMQVVNNGNFLPSCQVFVALNMGTSDYWFWPGWKHYPPETDWLNCDLAPGYNQWTVIPSFAWPDGAGSGSAELIAAVVSGGSLVSNVSTTSLHWTQNLPGFVRVPAGSFTMGSPTSEQCRSANEVQHTVIFTHGFYIQTTEVTQQQWIEVFQLNPSRFAGMQKPVEQVSFVDCCVYCNRLSMSQNLEPCYYSDPNYTNILDGTPPMPNTDVYWYQSAYGYRLPTESEWEYACRAGTVTAYNSAQNPLGCAEDPHLDPLGWYAYNSVVGSYQGTEPVGLKEANTWGLYDMHGNVSELCWDWKADYPTGTSTDPIGPETGSYRISRGGNWVLDAESCRSASRSSSIPDVGSSVTGFRVVRSTM